MEFLNMEIKLKVSEGKRIDRYVFGEPLAFEKLWEIIEQKYMKKELKCPHCGKIINNGNGSD
jgi:hypothetical protein